MDGSVLALFLISTFFGGLTTGLAGFAAGLVYSGVWLHIITPTQTALLIASYGIVNQSYSVWKLRHAFSWRRVLPFIAGDLVGVPIGVALLTAVSPAVVRIGVGVLLIVYASYNLLKPKIKPLTPTLSPTLALASSTECSVALRVLVASSSQSGRSCAIGRKTFNARCFSQSSWQP